MRKEDKIAAVAAGMGVTASGLRGRKLTVTQIAQRHHLHLFLKEANRRGR